MYNNLCSDREILPLHLEHKILHSALCELIWAKGYHNKILYTHSAERKKNKTQKNTQKQKLILKRDYSSFKSLAGAKPKELILWKYRFMFAYICVLFYKYVSGLI